MTAIEKAAQALHTEACRVMDTEESPWQDLPEELRDMYRGQARAAVAAIREPDEAMKRACGGDESILDGYEAMIDAALAEGPAKP